MPLHRIGIKIVEFNSQAIRTSSFILQLEISLPMALTLKLKIISDNYKSNGSFKQWLANKLAPLLLVLQDENL